MKALLINPPTGIYVREDRCQSAVDDFSVSVLRPPMDLMMMASSLESAGWACRIRDYPVERGSWEVFKKDFKAFMPNALILSVTTPTLTKDLFACAVAKEINPAALTIAKGAHFLANDVKVLEDCKFLDVIIRGECEFAAKEIITAKNLSEVEGITYRENGSIKRNKDKDLLKELDLLPMPARHLVNNELYTRPDTGEAMAVIETSRGCPYECIFCLTGQVSGKTQRRRSALGIISEIRHCLDKFRIRNFHFKSDTFTLDKEWVINLCQEIIKQGLRISWLANSRVDTLDEERISWMKKAGCFAIGLGVESASPAILDKIRKGTTPEDARNAVRLCRKFKVKSYAYFMLGFPWDTGETIEDTVGFALSLDSDFADFFLPYPFPGTGLERISRELGILQDSQGEKAYSESVMGTQSLSKKELGRLRNNAMRRFYLRPGFIIKTLLTSGSPRVFLNYCSHGIKTFKKII